MYNLWEYNFCITNSFTLTQGWKFKMLSYTCYCIQFMQGNIFWGKVKKQNPFFNNWSALCCQLSLPAATCQSLHLLFLCLLNSLHLSSFAVSRKQRRNLKYRLRYTGLTFIDRPCSMHQIPDILTRCPEPFGIHHQSLCCLHLGLLFLLLRMLSHHLPTKCPHFPGSSSHCVVRHCSSFLKCLWLQMVETFLYFCISVVFRTWAFSL